MTASDCYGGSMKGQGTCGCFECTDCGLESLAMLEQDDDTGRHFCEECWRDDQHGGAAAARTAEPTAEA